MKIGAVMFFTTDSMQPAPLGRACHAIERHNAAGETWRYYIDAQTSLPAMVEGTSRSGDLLERYLFRDVRPDLPELASADAFATPTAPYPRTTRELPSITAPR